MPYWITDTLAGTPAFLWIFFGLGVPWALAVLPRADWRFRGQVLAVAIILGAAILTLWMFILGTIGALRPHAGDLLRFDLVFGGTVVLALIGLLIALLKRRAPAAEAAARSLIPADERLLIILMGAALIVRWVVIAYWPFTAYDSLWVYGYEGKLYTLLGHIPNSIGYYPQYLPLQYTYGQLAFGAVNDHAARAGLIVLHLASTLAVYVMGRRLFNRRTGVFAAALWGLYPHVGEWSRAGDLEILLATLFTLAAAFFLLAWTGREHRRTYAALAGLMLGIGLWTKPTMGAFVWGVLLLGAVELAERRFNWRAAWPRLQLILITGLASAPVGGVWYIRNILLGHAAVDFPPDFWLTQAMRSGSEFGWPLLVLIGYVLWAFFGTGERRPALLRCGAGLALVIAALLPSIIDPHRMQIMEWLLLAVGIALLLSTLIPHARAVWDAQTRRDACVIGYGLLLALPYFVTWFYSYSYHYRLSFAIVPLMQLPLAVLLARWEALWKRRAAASIAVVALAVPGILSAVYDPFEGWDYLWTDRLPDDTARYRSGNESLMNVVDGLNAWKAAHPDETLHVSAPGVDRLPFFFPLDAIDVDTVPVTLDQIDDAVYFIYGVPETSGRYGAFQPDNAVLGALGRVDVARRAWGMDDGTFRYDVFELNLDARFLPPAPNGPAQGEIVFGEFARYLGYDIGGLELWPGRRVIFHLYWQVLAPPGGDYMTFIHLLGQDGRLLANWDGAVGQSAYGYYSTLVWQPGEYITDERVIALPDGEPPVGGPYRLVIGLYDLIAQTRVPLTIDGVPAGDSLIIEDRILVLPTQP